ncbi:Dopey, N-terminal-domain-containing protein [Pisolithus microcarpus]|nr:Dopey, N-terminal-domain-containing protein [Pisolithus microcarpus]
MVARARDVAANERDVKSGADGRGTSHPSTKATERPIRFRSLSIRSTPKQVEKCLNAFDNVHEWADCISFLKQLLKTFQSYLQFKEIPHKLIVAKRLAQCLNPALPAGVHQRALDHILSVLGTEGLKHDLPLWSSGLFPFFEYASTSVKVCAAPVHTIGHSCQSCARQPTLLNLYDTYYLPLQHDLRPVMKSFILALLPGLEEETGEFFDKVLGLLDRLTDTVSPVFFIQNLWLVMITMPAARGSALNFLLRRLPALHGEHDITHVVGRDIGLMIRAFSAALEDDNLLVRRSALDILLQSMRMDSAALKGTQPEDCAILMKAATSVVLRRDLSLNRRLYTWLLGPDDKSEAQIVYLRQHGLQLLSTTLKNEMFTPSEEYAESRPFKIFISLLDKWEIGSPLTEILIYDALKAIHQHMESKSITSSDVAMTASTLLEAVEPSILWKQLLRSILYSIDDGNRPEAIRLTLFLLRELPVHDDEVRSVHLPIVFAALVEKLLTHIRENNSRATSLTVSETCVLQQEVLQKMMPEALQQRPKLSDTELQKSSTSSSPLVFATTFYGLDPPTTSNYHPAAPITTAFEQLLMLCQICAKCMVQMQGSGADLKATFSQLLSTLTRLVELFSCAPEASCVPPSWLEDMLDCLDMESVGFPLLDHGITLIIAIHRSSGLLPSAPATQKLVVGRMVKRLFRFLRHECAIYHVRAVDLVWTLESSTGHHYVESIIAQSLNSPNLCSLQEAFEAFGVLWRLTEDEVSPGFRLKVPMMIVLDTLRHEQPSIRRAGETWMRCSLRSYARVLEPIIYDLIDPTIRRKPCRTKIKGREVQGYIYEQAFDQRYVHHLLEVLLAIAQFGGQGFAKTARSYPISRSNHKPLAHRLGTVSIDPTANFLDALVEILSRFIQSEPKEQHESTTGPLNIKIQSASVDLLHAVVARGEIDYLSLEVLEPVVIGRLYFTVHFRRLDLQTKLLRILHSLISASTAHLAQANVLRSESSGSETGPRTYTMNPLLTQTLIDGISLPHNRVMLQHWLDFVLMAIQQFHPTLQGIISPIVDCLCRQLRAFLIDALLASQPDSTVFGEFITLLNAMERLLILGLTSQAELSQQDEDFPPHEKSATESSGILGLVSNVASSQTDDQLAPRSPGYRSLHEGIRVLFAIWINLVWTAPSSRRSEDGSLSVIYNRTRARCGRALEHLSRAHPNEVLESLVICWDRDLTLYSRDPKLAEDAAFELVDTLISSAHSAVHMICESIVARTPGLPSGGRKYTNSNLSDGTLLKFLEEYLSRLEGPLALQVWGRFIQLAKDVISNVREFRAQTYLLLRCLCVLGDKVTQTTAMEDRRIKKDLQDVFSKLLDACVTFSGRSSESASWIRRTTKESIMNGRSSPVPRGVSDQKAEDKAMMSLPDNAKPTWGSELPLQITNFIATTVLPNLRKFLPDNDKVASACSSIVYYVVNPAVKGKSRAPVIDILYDNRVFDSNTAAATRWKPVVKALFDSDKTSFGDLLSRIAENEMLLRSLNLRRLSFVLFTGEKNHFVTQLPSVQEKLVDILRNVPSPIVQSEVYLYRIVEQIIVTLPVDESEELPLILSASKCLDLLLTLQTEEFQMLDFVLHTKWIFVTDTVDAVYRPDNWTPYAIEGFPSDGQSSKMRHPMLNSLRQIDSIRDLIPFFSHVSISSYESIYANCW